MAVSRADKEQELGQLTDAFGRTASVILMEFRGIKVPEVTELRRQVRAVSGEYRVVNNTLARRAMKDTPFEALSSHFVGATAVAFSGDDPVARPRTASGLRSSNAPNASAATLPISSASARMMTSIYSTIYLAAVKSSAPEAISAPAATGAATVTLPGSRSSMTTTGTMGLRPFASTAGTS